ncbi:MAG: hypothetical protein JW754_03480 [Candidatus Aenigmarchaeota archaeon]|nr:hypothetical protein [Candidatus Aenigmarchaeota archaeon]
MKKGFMHIIEIVLVTLLLFFIFSQFIYIPRTSSDWSDTKLRIMANDVLQILESGGINWFDPDEVKSAIADLQAKDIVPGNIIYSLTLENVVKPEIKVGCTKCTSQDIEALTESLTDFRWNGIDVHFIVQNEDTLESAFYPYYDVVVLMNQEAFTPANTEAMQNYLDLDKGIVEVFDVSTHDGNQFAFFGIEGGTTNADDMNDIKFSPEARRAGSNIYDIYKLFTNINDGGELDMDYLFPPAGFLETTENTVWVENKSEVVLFQEGTGAAACVVRYYVINGVGRTAWVSGGDLLRSEQQVLLKSVITWAAGDVHKVIESRISNPVSASIYKTVNENAFQGIKITLTVGYPF